MFQHHFQSIVHLWLFLMSLYWSRGDRWSIVHWMASHLRLLIATDSIQWQVLYWSWNYVGCRISSIFLGTSKDVDIAGLLRKLYWKVAFQTSKWRGSRLRRRHLLIRLCSFFHLLLQDSNSLQSHILFIVLHQLVMQHQNRRFSVGNRHWLGCSQVLSPNVRATHFCAPTKPLCRFARTCVGGDSHRLFDHDSLWARRVIHECRVPL